MATKFITPVIALALLIMFSLVGKPPEEKGLMSWKKNLHQLTFAEEELLP